MDTNQFRLVSQPNPYASFNAVNVNTDSYNLSVDIAPDNRHPSWPATLNDARYSDYSSHCSKNVPAGEQFPTKQWLINNANAIIGYSRKNQFTNTQALDKSVVPPPAQIAECTAGSCTLLNTNLPNGIGVQREYTTPDLFGTFGGADAEEKPKDMKLTQTYEGGRNSRRGNKLLPY